MKDKIFIYILQPVFLLGSKKNSGLCDLVFLLSRVQSLPPRSHLGCGTQIFRPGREQHMLSLINTGHSFTLLSASSLEVHAFPFILHSYLFSISSCKSFMTSKYGTEIAWTTANPQALLPRSNAALSSL